MSSPSMQTVRYYVELFRRGEISSVEMHAAIKDALQRLKDDAESETEEIRQGVCF